MKNLQIEGFGKNGLVNTIESEGTDVNDGDSGVFQFKKNTKVLKNDMNKIAENLEKIRDMFINKGENGKIYVTRTPIKNFWSMVVIGTRILMSENLDLHSKALKSF